MIFWHESSATEPGGTAHNGRARQPGAANIAAMPVAGSVPLFALPPAGRVQRGRSCDHGADRSAVSRQVALQEQGAGRQRVSRRQPFVRPLRQLSRENAHCVMRLSAQQRHQCGGLAVKERFSVERTCWPIHSDHGVAVVLVQLPAPMRVRRHQVCKDRIRALYVRAACALAGFSPIC